VTLFKCIVWWDIASLNVYCVLSNRLLWLFFVIEKNPEAESLSFSPWRKVFISWSFPHFLSAYSNAVFSLCSNFIYLGQTDLLTPQDFPIPLQYVTNPLRENIWRASIKAFARQPSPKRLSWNSISVCSETWTEILSLDKYTS